MGSARQPGDPAAVQRFLLAVRVARTWRVERLNQYSDAGLAGVYLYAGIPKSGKSTLCLSHTAADILATGRPAFVLDPETVDTYRGLHHAAKPGDVKEWLFGQGVSIAYTHPKEQEIFIGGKRVTVGGPNEIETPVNEVVAGGNVTLLADEVHYYSSPHYVSKAIEHAARAHRHHKMRLRLNTQRLADLNEDLKGCATVVYIFRLMAGPDSETAWKRWRIPEERSTTLAQYEFIEIRVGF